MTLLTDTMSHCRHLCLIRLYNKQESDCSKLLCTLAEDCFLLCERLWLILAAPDKDEPKYAQTLSLE